MVKAKKLDLSKLNPTKAHAICVKEQKVIRGGMWKLNTDTTVKLLCSCGSIIQIKIPTASGTNGT